MGVVAAGFIRQDEESRPSGSTRLACYVTNFSFTLTLLTRTFSTVSNHGTVFIYFPCTTLFEDKLLETVIHINFHSEFQEKMTLL